MRNSYARAARYFLPDWPHIVVLLVLVAVSIGLGLLQAWPTAILVDTVLTPRPASQLPWVHRLFLAPLPANRLGQIIGVAAIGMGLKVVQDTIWMLRMMLNNRIRYAGLTRVRGELFDKLQRLGPAYHRGRPQGDAIYRLTADTAGPFGVLDTFVASGVAAVNLVGMTAIMLSRNAWLTAFALSVAPVLVATNCYFGRRIKARSAESKQIDAEFTTVVQRAMTAVDLTQAFNRQPLEAARFRTSVGRSVAAWMRLNWQEQLYPLAVNVLFAVGGAVIFGYGGWLVYRDQFLRPVPDPVTCGDLMVFMVYLGNLWDPLRCLTSFTANVQTHAAASERVFEVLDHPVDVPEAPHPEPLPARPRTLELRNVGFGYGAAAPLLRGVSATVEAGQFVAFVGPSGAGKSTLLSLLLRFYDPTTGSVRLGGRDVREVSLADLRRHVALVTQESVMLAGTIRENLAYGRPDATGAELAAAAKLAGAAEFIDSLPDGMDTRVSEGGRNFSGGQRQRLAIARAIVSDAPILVLDEPTSALDPEHARQLVGALHRLKRRRTVILVSHDLSAVAACDRIYVLQSGRIAESGTHAELSKRPGRYAAMARDAGPLPATISHAA